MPPHDIVREAVILGSISNRNIITILDFVRGGPNAPYALYMPVVPLPVITLLSSPLFSPYPITGPYSALAQPVLAPPRAPGGANPFVVVTKSLVYQLLSAISYLHSQDPPIAHRDVNPGNILVDRDGTVKLIDFGIAWTGQAQVVPSPRMLLAKGSESASKYLYKDWKETPEEMCCQVATGPHRPPELLFSPRSYSAVGVDLWSLGTTIAQFFTPLRLNSSTSPLSSPSSTTSDDEPNDMTSAPFLVSANLEKNIDYRATWERQTLFNGERGELGLAWSIFWLRGTPDENSWPSFSSLPDVSAIQFREARRKPLHRALPHLPPAQSLTNESPASLIDALLAYDPAFRLAAKEALDHPWFSTDLLLPLLYPVHSGIVQGNKRSWETAWEGRSLAEWLEPVMKREASRMIQVSI
ncbi:kinase-like protein [Ramaria rubella]|nr:kinase-like protein [Ramaria rubella]